MPPQPPGKSLLAVAVPGGRTEGGVVSLPPSVGWEAMSVLGRCGRAARLRASGCSGRAAFRAWGTPGPAAPRGGECVLCVRACVCTRAPWERARAAGVGAGSA